jgi:Zn-dependent membrane protease YugP
MTALIVIILLVCLILGPQIWAKHVLQKYSTPVAHFPGNGAELARHILDKFSLQQIQVETTEQGDHYDPMDRTVRLEADRFDGRSLTAVAVAAHEVGHAIQHALDYRPLLLRTRMVHWVQWADKGGVLFVMLIPVVMGIARSPLIGVASFAVAACLFCLPVVVHLITLPVEWDASFGRALPILRASGYFSEQELSVIQRILRACAFTYVAASLSSLLNFWRWIAILRR